MIHEPLPNSHKDKMREAEAYSNVQDSAPNSRSSKNSLRPTSHGFLSLAYIGHDPPITSLSDLLCSCLPGDGEASADSTQRFGWLHQAVGESVAMLRPESTVASLGSVYPTKELPHY